MKFDKIWFRHDEATSLGSSDKAIIIEFVRWSIHYKESTYGPEMKSKYFFDGHWWMQDGLAAWAKRIPWVSERTVRRYLDELCSEGYLVKKTAGNPFTGREPNYYRLGSKLTHEEENTFPPEQAVITNLSTPHGQTAPPLRTKRHDPSCQNGRYLPLTKSHPNESSNIYVDAPTSVGTASKAGSSLDKNQTLRKESQGGNTWEGTDPFRIVFENLNRLSICKARFDTQDYRKWITGLMQDLSLTIAELEKLSNEWQEYHNEKTQKPKVAKSSFRTWIMNYIERRAKNAQRQPGKSKWQQEPRKLNIASAGSPDDDYSKGW